MRITAVFLMLLFALPLAAQAPQAPPPSADKESFTIQPGSVERGARNFAIRMVANKAAGFSNSSSKAPALTFSAGVKLVAGSLQVLNQNEAQASIDVDNEAAGTIEVKLDLFSVNGSKILTTLRATLGIKGTIALGGSQAEVGAESVKLVQVNVATPQTAGALLIKGEVSGAVRITAPTGTNFAAAPVATIDNGQINSPALEQTNTVFTFSIGNASLADVTVRVDSIQYNTQFFGLVAAQGDLACELTGAALSNQTALVVNAFTAKTEVKGGNDNSETAPPANNGDTGSEESASTSQPSTGAVEPQGRSLDNSRTERPSRDRETRNPGSSNGGGTRLSEQPRSNGGAGNQAPLPDYNQPAEGGAPAPAAGGGAAVSPGGAAGSNEMGGTGSITNENVEKEEVDKKLETAKPGPRELEISPGLHFCDKDFKPVTALVLDKAVAGEAGGRVWIVLKLKADKQPDKIETATIKLTVNGVTRELALTETGKNTGEFRCGEDGILVIANENPDSNTEEKAAEPPKPRFDR
jgi:hypothetical protein